MLKDLILQNPIHIIWAATVILVALIILLFVFISHYFKYRKYRIEKIVENDKNYKLTKPDGKVQEGVNRNIWDYAPLPGFSRLLHQPEWPIIFAASLILIFVFLWLYTRDNAILNLLGINLGVVIGMMIQKAHKS